MSDKLAKEREAMAAKLGIIPPDTAAYDIEMLDEFIRIEKIEGPIAFYRKQLEVFGGVRERRNSFTGCCPNCGNALTIRIERT